MSDFNESWISKQPLEKYSDIKFDENPSRGAKLLHVDRQTDILKQIVTYSGFADTYKKHSIALKLKPNLFWDR